MTRDVKSENWPLRCEQCDARIGLDESVCLVNVDGLIVATGSPALETDRRRHRAGMRLLHLACAEDLIRASMERRRIHSRSSELALRSERRPSRPRVASVEAPVGAAPQRRRRLPT